MVIRHRLDGVMLHVGDVGSREIAEQLVISPLTVRTHIEHLSEKLEVNGRRAIIARAAEMNLMG